MTNPPVEAVTIKENIQLKETISDLSVRVCHENDQPFIDGLRDARTKASSDAADEFKDRILPKSDYQSVVNFAKKNKKGILGTLAGAAAAFVIA